MMCVLGSDSNNCSKHVIGFEVYKHFVLLGQARGCNRHSPAQTTRNAKVVPPVAHGDFYPGHFALGVVCLPPTAAQ
eukprot:13703243-Heterocapsa_arctica.AAC.1